MTSPITENAPEAAVPADVTAPAQQAPPKTLVVAERRHPASKSKKDQLLALIAKPPGARISVLTERLGWQAHTVRAALSGLRKQGHLIQATKAPKTGEAVYRLVSSTRAESAAAPAGGAS